MENDKKLEQDKQAFFAQHWNQDVFKMMNDTMTMRVGSIITSFAGYLELTPLSAISDEHAIEVAKIMYPKDKHNDKDSLEWGKEIALEIIQGESDKDVIWFAGILPVIDFLRRNGYLLPYAGYTTDQLIEMGWVKLKQH